MSEEVATSKKSIDWKWLLYIVLSALAMMVLGIENLIEKWPSIIVLILFILFPLLVRGPGSIGISAKNLGSSILVGACVGIVYGAIRGVGLKFLPLGGLIFGADLLRMVPKVEAGFTIGPLVLNKTRFLLLWALLIPGFGMLELYFRGVLFPGLKKHMHWTGALAATSVVQSVARRTPHSLIMGSLAGVLMQRYDNILAPISMHAFQFLVALAIVLFT